MALASPHSCRSASKPPTTLCSALVGRHSVVTPAAGRPGHKNVISKAESDDRTLRDFPTSALALVCWSRPGSTAHPVLAPPVAKPRLAPTQQKSADETSRTFQLAREDHTLGNALRYTLMRR